MRHPSLEQLDSYGFSHPGHYNQRTNLWEPASRPVLRSLSMPENKECKRYHDGPGRRTIVPFGWSRNLDHAVCDEAVVELIVQDWRSLRLDYAAYVEGRYV